jgi:hypothetical protein
MPCESTYGYRCDERRRPPGRESSFPRSGPTLTTFITAGAGFLLAVLWFDLMFDVQALARGEGELPEEALASIAAYYARVTTRARPMNRLVACVMVVTLALIVAEIAAGEVRAWVAWVSLALALAPIALAGAHTVPSAVRLGSRADPPAQQSTLARSVLHEHLFCLVAIATLLALQLAFG